MCGIGGIVRVWAAGAVPPPPDVAIPERWLDVIDESIKHRGPDGQGRFRDRAVRADGFTIDVAFVHRRLSIIDHSGGHQPMVSEAPAPSTQSKFGTGRVAVVFNGCIYNHRDLRRELVATGHQFVTDHSDTEVLIHAWREWGPAMFERLDGMYALILWDAAVGKAVVARDTFGEKPLYEGDLGQELNAIALGSCATGIARLLFSVGGTAQSGPIRGRAVRGWMKFGWNGEMPMSWMRQVGVGQWECVGEGEFGYVNSVVKNAWTPGFEAFETADVERALQASVRSRLESDVDCGCFLSGGVDSGLVTAMAAREYRRIQAFTVQMPDPALDESKEAAEVARAIGVPHTVLFCDPSPAEDLVAAIEQLGLPFGDSSLLPSLWLSRAARKAVKVAIGGDGGDELFMGYDRHRVLRPLYGLSCLPTGVCDAAINALDDIAIENRATGRLRRMLNAGVIGEYKELLSIFPASIASELLCEPDGFSSERMRHMGTSLDARQGWGWPAWLAWARQCDLCSYLPEDLLRKSDTASMAVALELRSPMLSPAVASLVSHGSLRSLMPHGQRKGLLRQIARNYLPAHIVDRPKRGFAIPIGEWFRSDFGSMKTLLMDMLHSADPYPAGLLGLEINRRFVDQMIDEHMTHKRDHSQRLYMMLVLAIWARWLQRTLRQPT